MHVLNWIVCLTAAAATLALAVLPFGLEAQLALVVASLAVMALIKLFDLRGPFRAVFLSFGTFVILRYVAWRLTSTVPSPSSPADFAAGMVLICAELYCVVMLFLSLFTVADPIDRPRAPQLSDREAPTVDVFVPSYDEGVDILAPTLAAAKRMIYPADKLNVFLLDDGGTDEKIASSDPHSAARAKARRETMQALCAELGVRYLARRQNRHAKAGNLNNGLAHSDAQLVVVFDADHAPERGFLRETVGFFDADEKLFLVQTPHFFLNPDPIEKNIAAAGIPTENEMFYGLIQKGLDRWNAAFFCGSAAVLRRDALDEVGGFHGSSITEDAESALELHARGWKSLYVDKPMIAGLQPETFESFIGQRSRWCRGMVQILLLKNPLFKAGLTLPQRLCYLSSSMFWLFPLSRMVFVFAPMLFIFFNMKIYVANWQEFLAYTMTYMAAALLIQSYMFGRLRWPWASDVYEYIQSVVLFRAVLSVFIAPRRPKFNVTAKGQSLEQDGLSSLAGPYFAIFGLIVASLGVLAYRYLNEPEVRDLIVVVGVWTCLNALLAGLALGAVAERRERRAMPRVPSELKASLAFGDERIPVVIENVSCSGLSVRIGDGHLPNRVSAVLRVEPDVPGGRTLEVPVTGLGRRTAGSVRSCGLRFHGISGDRFRFIAQLMFSDVSPIRTRRVAHYVHLGVLAGTAVFALAWVRQIGRGLAYAARGTGTAEAPLADESERSAA